MREDDGIPHGDSFAVVALRNLAGLTFLLRRPS